MKTKAVSGVANFSNDFKVTAIVDKLPKELRSVIVKVAGFQDAVIHRVATVNKTFLLPTPDLPRSATIYLSTRNLDADMDIVLPTGWDKSLYRGQGLWAHDYKLDPIYKAIDTGTDDYGLWQVIQFAETERGDNYWKMVRDGFLQTFSAGMWVKPDGAVVKAAGQKFQDLVASCKDWPEFTAETAGDVERFLVQKYLIESTLCNVPANPYAMVVAVNKGELELSEGVRKEIRFDDIVKKCQDSGQMKGKTISPPPEDKESDKAQDPAGKANKEGDNDAGKKPDCDACPLKIAEQKREQERAEAAKKSIPSVRVVPTVTVIAPAPIETLVEKSLEKRLARIRGKI